MKSICQNNIKYVLDVQNHTASIITNGLTGDIIISKSITHENQEYTILSIKENNIRCVVNLKSIVFNGSLLSKIGSYSFYNDSKIQKVIFPPHLREIDFCAFCRCKNLKSIEFSEGIRFLNYSAFRETNIQEVVFPSHLKTIGEYCFYKTNLQYVEIPDDSEINYIGKCAFGLTEICDFSIPENLNSKKNIFTDTPYLNSITVSKYNKHYTMTGDGLLLYKENELNLHYDILFYAIKNVTKIVIPSSIKEIGSDALEKCNNLKEIEFSDNSQLQIIRKRAFYCSSIETIKLPPCVKIIEKESFKECKHLQIFEITDNSNLYSIGKYAFYASGIKFLNIPSKVQKIGEFAFGNCSNLQTIEFKNKSSLVFIGNNCFESSSIEKIVIPSSVQQIGEYCFNNCRLKSVEFDQNNSYLCIIEKCTFQYTNINDITIPSSVQKIENYSFNNCTSLKSINFSDNTELNFFGENSFSKSILKQISIPSSVQIIDSNAFSDCLCLEKIEFKNDSELYLINSFAFNNCKNLEEITIPSNVKIIGDSVFANCYNLSSIKFLTNSQLLSIGNNAFESTLIDEIFLPSNVENIHANCFKKVLYLYKIEISKDNKHFAFVNNSLLLYKKNVKSDVYDTLVFVCNDVKEVKIPNYVRKIEMNAFEGCNKLVHFETSKESNLCLIHKNIFKEINLQEIVIPFRLINISTYLHNYSNIKRIGIVDEEVNIDEFTFIDLPNLEMISFPYAKKINVGTNIDNKLYILKRCNSSLTGDISKHSIRNVDEELIETKIFVTDEEQLLFYHKKIGKL